jgi:tRNA threonylcarbamoyladenosine biosynthesis protein TsaB
VLSSLRKKRLEAIAVARGPGAFTSLRIGVITAKALAHRLGVPLIGVATTEAVAWPLAQGAAGTVAVLLPAWKSSIYAAAYRAAGEDLLEVLAPCALDPAAVSGTLARLAGPITVAGAEALEVAFREALGEGVECAPASLAQPTAASVAAAARARLAQGDPRAAFELRPLYIVPSQAERTAGIDLGLTGQ